jgi:hypothetical protein
LLPGVVAVSEQVPRGGGNYTRVTCDDKLNLTISTADGYSSLPRHAHFRAGYAKQVQFGLFDENEPDAVENPYYAIITHGPSYYKTNSELPLAFCQIGFPDSEYSSFIHQVDLLKLYAPLFAKLHANEPIEIGQATAELLENIKRAKNNAS